ncbi:MAG: riboflavin synthase [Endomicrobium sp.]|jgi:riboflavin synthase|nr:riboflavin synthase [Endomicrobium sp.]
MFTGLIEDIGVIKNISTSRVEVETKLGNIKKGDSISVNGVCLTAVSVSKNSFIADYSSHTDKVTTLARLKQNTKVNLEQAVTLSSRLGGHIVSGHVDGKAVIKKIRKLKGFYCMIFSCDTEVLSYCIKKGSISVDGISLTISSLLDFGFEIFIIPETFNNTTMQFRKTGDEVNIETDIFAKYMKKFINKATSDISFKMLKRNGFV